MGSHESLLTKIPPSKSPENFEEFGPKLSSRNNGSNIEELNYDNHVDRLQPIQPKSNTKLKPSTQSISVIKDPICACGEPKVKRTTLKDGPNKGRDFYICPKGGKNECPNSFMWASDLHNPMCK